MAGLGHHGLTIGYVLTDPPILIVLTVFISAMVYTLKSYLSVSKNLKSLHAFLGQFKKADLNFRFREIDEWMSLNSYVSSKWNEFKNTLVFSESVALANRDQELTYTEVSTMIQNIQTTVDPLYFFTEEDLIKSKFNHKLIEQFPVILTGCGPLFTFMNIIFAFGALDFASAETILKTVADLMSIMQVAALVSVIAMSSMLTYVVTEKISWERLCVEPYHQCATVIGALFDNISTEKFLLELLKETKIQNNTVANLIAGMPDDLRKALIGGIAGNVVPYLENVIFGVNQLNKSIKESAKAGDDFF
jgi:hypothetical protein